MCGRTACTLAPDEVSRACVYRTRAGGRRRPRWRDGDGDKYQPSYNKSPQSHSPILLSHRHFDEGAPVDECVLTSMRWGLVPAWFKEDDPSKMQYSTSNCRSENILSKKSYRDPMIKGQRCVVLADGFYEWKKEDKVKQPFFIYFPQSQTASQDKFKAAEDGPADCAEHSETEASADPTEDKAPAEWTGWRLLTIAGLFDCWTPPNGGEPLYTYSVITVNASPNLQSIHHRMPAVLDGEEEVRKWLDFGEVKSLGAMELLQSKDTLTFHPVSTLVNSSRNNSPECLQPIDLNSKKGTKPTPTPSSKRMMSWLKSSTPTKRKAPDTLEKDKESSKAECKPAGALLQWLQGANKKPKTSV